MELKKAQGKVKEFDKKREWEDDWHLKDISLNLVEEIGELWNLIKWIDEKEQREVVKENKEKVKDFIGDSLFLILKMANKTKVDTEDALNETINEYKKRMPSEKLKKHKHANTKAGGIDNKS